MLTDSERHWLEEREFLCNRCDGAVGPNQEKWCGGAKDGWKRTTCKAFYRSCVMYIDFRDCAEFEARVQKKQLLLWSGGKARCPYKHCCAVFVVKKHWTEADKLNVCGWCIQRFARLAVEEEMQ